MSTSTTSTSTKLRSLALCDWEVRAVMEGRKTQIRRPISPQPTPWRCNAPGMEDIGGLQWKGRCYEADSPDDIHTKSPFGQPGERLCVKENWQKSGIGWGNDLPAGKVHYRATDNGEWRPYWGSWRSSAQMPAWASRITLEVKRVWVEQLRDVGTEAAFREGIEIPGSRCSKSYECSRATGWPGLGAFDDPESQACGGRPYMECWCVLPALESLWNTTSHGKRHPWSPDLWVFAAEIERVEN